MPWEKWPNAGLNAAEGSEGAVVVGFGCGDAAEGTSSLFEVFLRMTEGGAG